MEIGAENTAEICRKALSAFGGSVPADRDKRQEAMEELESDVFSEILEECDEEFSEYADNLTELNYAHIVKNKNLFS